MQTKIIPPNACVNAHSNPPCQCDTPSREEVLGLAKTRNIPATLRRHRRKCERDPDLDPATLASCLCRRLILSYLRNVFGGGSVLGGSVLLGNSLSLAIQ